MYYNKQGKEINVGEFDKLLGDEHYKFVKQETLKNGKFVSTVWIGLCHRLGDDTGSPLIFETMVFPEEGDWIDLDVKRYSTLEEAEKGHKEMVKKWNNIK